MPKDVILNFFASIQQRSKLIGKWTVFKKNALEVY